MKKIIIGLVIFIFGLLMLTFSAWQARAEEDVLGDQTVSVATPADPVKVLLDQEVLYYLPYPGILPDHPVYWTKMLRDRIVELLTTNNEKRVDLWILYADKRLGAAKVLVEGNKAEQGVLTATKANGYLTKAVARVEEMKGKGVNVGEVANKMERETLKHAQILDQLSKRENGDNAGKLNNLKESALKLHERIQIVLERN